MSKVRIESGVVRVLGVDPGTRLVGLAVLDIDRAGGSTLVHAEVVRLATAKMESRLEKIFARVGEVIQHHTPAVLAIEEVFHGRNFQSILKVGQARGVVILAGQIAGLDVHEYSTRLVKKSATGNGNADKSQVQSMMIRLLSLKSLPETLDVSDAMAVAFCHGQRLWREAQFGPATAAPPKKARSNLPSRGGATPKGTSRDKSREKLIEQMVKLGKAKETTRRSSGPTGGRVNP